MRFQKITLVDNCGLTPEVMDQLADLSVEPLTVFNDDPITEDELLHRIGFADCVLVSWRTRLSAGLIQSAPKLKYIGMCCSLYDEHSANVDIVAARKQGIVVKGVRDYGDDGTLEYIFAELIYLFKGLGKHRWQTENRELRGKSMGIVGMGTLGTMVARTAKQLGMNVFYFSRRRKPDLETEGFNYLSLNDLMASCDVVSTHLPKNAVVLGPSEFELKKRNSVLVNTSIGLTFEKDSFLKWLERDPTSFAILDGPGMGEHLNEFSGYPNIICSKVSSGFTFEAKARLSDKVLKNIREFFAVQEKLFS